MVVFSVGSAGSNTNKCLALLSDLRTECGTSLSPPQQSCCYATSNFNIAGCLCNSAMATVMGVDYFSQVMNILKPVCMGFSLRPMWWVWAIVNGVNFGYVDCEPFHVNSYECNMCGLSDMDLDNARLQAVQGLSAVLKTDYNERDDTCFDIDMFQAAISPYMDPEPSVIAGYGLGVYSTLRSASEFLAVSDFRVNCGLLGLGVPDIKTDPSAILYFTDTSVIVGGSVQNNWMFDTDGVPCRSDSVNNYQEQIASFEGCGTVIKTYFLLGSSVVTGLPTGLAADAKAFFDTAVTSSTWGIQGICDTHDMYCTGLNQQFSSRDECLRFMHALPAFSPVCGVGGIMGGNSTACRFKHHFMIPLDPSTHCFHIGYGDGVYKCNDVVECQYEYPALSDPAVIDVSTASSIHVCAVTDGDNYSGPRAANLCV